jgi:hypothetical protein
MAVLSKTLFEQDPDEYVQSMTAAIERKSASVMPELGVSVCISLFESVFPQVGLKKAVKKWKRSLVESLENGYVFAREESWEDLDRDHARTLLQDSLVAAVAEAWGEPPDASAVAELPPAGRLEALLRGLGSREGVFADFFADFREYVFSRGAYLRVDHFANLFLGIGRAMDKVKPRDAEAYKTASTAALYYGLHVGVLDIIGELAPQPV